MSRGIDGHGIFWTPDGLDIRVSLAIVLSGDGPPRVEISSIQDPTDLVTVEAVDRAAKVLLRAVTYQLRRRSYAPRPVTPDPKPKHRAKPRGGGRSGRAT
jgi:hypothetical protein